MTDPDIAALDVESLAARDCVLFLWATWPRLPVALAVMEAWGFKYVTGFPWVKLQPYQSALFPNQLRPAFGVGYWVRGCSEAVLIGKRGRARRPKSAMLGLLSDRLAHSQKPSDIYMLAERWPGPYVELFARQRRSGWDAHGDEIAGGVALNRRA